MTGFINSGSIETRIVGEDDWRLNSIADTDLEREVLRGGDADYFYGNNWWPRPGGLEGGVLEATWRSRPDLTSGRNSRLGFLGVTRDVYGSPVGGVTVKLFLSSTDEKLDQTVSDPLGNFFLSTPYHPAEHQITFYKDGAPPIRGITVNTLKGS